MILSAAVEIRLSGFPSTIIQVRVSLKRLTDDAAQYGRLEKIDAQTLLEKIVQVYTEERGSDASLPALPDSKHLALLQGGTEFEATDDVSHAVSCTRHDNAEYKLAVIDIRERKTQTIRRVVEELQNQIVAGGVGGDDHYVVVQIPSTDEKVVCFKPNSALIEFLRTSVLRNDQRMFQQNGRRGRHGTQRDDREEASGMDSFTIRFRLSEFARHSHRIINVVSQKKGENWDAPTRTQDSQSELGKESVNVDTFINQAKKSDRNDDYGDRRDDFATWEQLEEETKLSLVSLAIFLRDELEAKRAQWQEIFDSGQVSFESLVVLLGTGTKVVTESEDGFLQGGRVTEINLVPQGNSQHPCDTWVIKVKTISSNGVQFSPTTAELMIVDFSPKLRSINALPLRPISDDDHRRLTERGRIYRDLAVGAHHKAYLGPMRVSPQRTVRADGRIMVDIERFYIHTQGGIPGARHDDDDDDYGYRQGRASSKATYVASVFQEKALAGRSGRHSQRTPQGKGDGNQYNPLDDSMLWMTPPSLPAFSFRHHNFGILHVELISEIVWKEGAWNQLVLPDVKKDLIRALVLQTRSQAEVNVLERRRWASTLLVKDTTPDQDGDSGGSAESERNVIDSELTDEEEMDIVPGKGGGCTMLLHGKSGTGKTLTAEAVSELLKRPLYAVTVGELGTTPAQLEAKLTEVLELASCWHATILLDEADVFLAKRNDDIHRNGLVSIFLRTIEYFNGVLILTSNLADTIDEAFASRIHVSLHYPELGVTERAKVWRNFLGKWSSQETPFDYEKLAAYILNGRQIRSAVRVARSLSQDNQESLTQSMIEKVVTETMRE